jgi:23S rRNA-/tRNA-specific pseudouridylate synthase
MTEKLKIIFEDENILAVDKPSGLVVHTDGRTEEKSLVDWLNEYMSGGVAPAHQSTIGNPHTLDSGRYVARWGRLS